MNGNEIKVKKLLHFGLAKLLGSGVKNQLRFEVSAAVELKEVQWQTVFFSHSAPSNAFMRRPRVPKMLNNNRLIMYLWLRVSAYTWLIKNQSKYDIVLIRYPLGDPIFALYSLFLKSFLTIHHTKELPEIESNKSLLGRIHKLLEVTSSKIILSRSKGFISLTREIDEYEKRRSPAGFLKHSYIYPNGIEVAKDLHLPDTRSGKVKVVCICSKPYPWQGIDLLLEACAKRSDIELHMVGEISANDYSLTLGDSVFFHGPLASESLTSFLSGMDLGIGSLALYRKGMREACTLKTREYLSHGLPVYCNHIDSGFPAGFEFIVNEPFSADRAIELAMVFRKYSRDDIRTASAEHMDKQKLMANLAAWLLKVNSQ